MQSFDGLTLTIECLLRVLSYVLVRDEVIVPINLIYYVPVP